jgi:hypothetical protein
LGALIAACDLAGVGNPHERLCCRLSAALCRSRMTLPAKL